MFSFGLVCVDQISACMFVSESEREDIASCYGTVQKKQTKKNIYNSRRLHHLGLMNETPKNLCYILNTPANVRVVSLPTNWSASLL